MLCAFPLVRSVASSARIVTLKFTVRCLWFVCGDLEEFSVKRALLVLLVAIGAKLEVTIKALEHDASNVSDVCHALEEIGAYDVCSTKLFRQNDAPSLTLTLKNMKFSCLA